MLATPLSERLPQRALGLLCLALLPLAPALADEAAAPAPLRLSGFATAALTHNDNGEAGAIVSYSQKKPVTRGWSPNLDSVLGLQLDWQILADTSAALQTVARAGNGMEPELRMGYLRQQWGRLALRAGRIRSPLYFDSDVAEIGYAYPLSRPPIPLYGIVSSVAALDGGDAQWRDSFGNSAVLLQAYYGNYQYRQRFYNFDPATPADARLDDIRGVAVSVSRPNITVRASRTWIGNYTLRSDQIGQINAGLGQLSGALTALSNMPGLSGLAAQAGRIGAHANPFDNHPIYTSVGFDANAGAWRLLGEATRLDSHSSMVGKYDGLHLAAGYSLGEWTPYLSLARERRVGPRLDTGAFGATGLDPALDGALAQMRAGLDEAARFADISTRAVSVGVRWDLRDNMAVKLQYDRMRTPGAGTPGNFAVTRLPFDNRVNLFTVALDVVF